MPSTRTMHFKRKQSLLSNRIGYLCLAFLLVGLQLWEQHQKNYFPLDSLTSFLPERSTNSSLRGGLDSDSFSRDIIRTTILWESGNETNNIGGQLARSVNNSVTLRRVTEDCLPTSHLRIVQEQTAITDKYTNASKSSRTSFTSRWFLVSMDGNKAQKEVGGDEYFVTYHDASWNGARATHVAKVKDQKNGIYLLDFYTTPMYMAQSGGLTNFSGFGKVTVTLMHTCSVGTMHPPTKDSWRDGGLLNIKFRTETLPIPPFQYFARPNHEFSFSHHDLLISFGDSLHKQFVKKGERRWHRPSGLTWYKNPDRPLTTETVPQFMDLLQDWHGHQLTQNKNVGIVIGSAAWDVLHAPNHTETLQHDPSQGVQFFSDHLNACQQYAKAVVAAYPTATVYWRLPYALQPHAVRMASCMEKPVCVEATRYMSQSRMEILYYAQKRVLSSVDKLHLIDLYEASYLSGEWSPIGDGRHYLVNFNRMVLDWFYEGTER